MMTIVINKKGEMIWNSGNVSNYISEDLLRILFQENTKLYYDNNKYYMVEINDEQIIENIFKSSETLYNPNTQEFTFTFRDIHTQEYVEPPSIEEELFKTQTELLKTRQELNELKNIINGMVNNNV